MRKRLLALYDTIDARARTTTEAHPFWPCRRGCDTCCRRLADEPRMTHEEWRMLKEGIERLSNDVRLVVEARIAALSTREPSAHVICPMLDREAGACLVYAHRPSACRTYGFYVRRRDGIHCTIVEDAVQTHDTSDVVWGNHESVDHALAVSFGSEASLSSWFAERVEEPSSPSSEI